MASTSPFLSLPFFFSLLFLANTVNSLHSPAPSPSLPPQSPADEISPPPATPSPAPSPSSSLSSPPAPPPSDLPPNSPPPKQDKKSPSPAIAGDVNHENQSNVGDLETEEKSSGGMSSGQKAGVAIGVIAGACIVGAGAFVYKKRQQNLQRSQYGYAARRELL